MSTIATDIPASLLATEVVERRTEGFQCPWVHDRVFCSRCAHRLHLLEARLVSVAEFTAASGHL